MKHEPQYLNVGVRLSNYRIERVLGYGANGIAYLATDKNLGRKVVIKEHYPVELCKRNQDTQCLEPLNDDLALIFNESVLQFAKEAQMIATLDHPSIIKIHEVFSLSNTTYFYVMPYMEGGNIRDYRLKDNHVSPKQITNWLIDLVSALEYLESHHILHLDIKPDNILLSNEGRPVLADFGIAGVNKENSFFSVLAHSKYSPPEVFDDHPTLDSRTDMYSLSACFYELITGKAPPSAIERAEKDTLKPLYQLNVNKFYPYFLIQSLDKNLSFSPQDRYKTSAVWSSLLELPNPPHHRSLPGFIYLLSTGLLTIVILTFVFSLPKTQPYILTTPPTGDHIVPNKSEQIKQVFQELINKNGAEEFIKRVDNLEAQLIEEDKTRLLKWKQKINKLKDEFQQLIAYDLRIPKLNEIENLQEEFQKDCLNLAQERKKVLQPLSDYYNDQLWKCQESDHPLLAEYPEWIPLLNDQIEQKIKEHGNNVGLLFQDKVEHEIHDYISNTHYTCHQNIGNELDMAEPLYEATLKENHLIEKFDKATSMLNELKTDEKSYISEIKNKVALMFTHLDNNTGNKSISDVNKYINSIQDEWFNRCVKKAKLYNKKIPLLNVPLLMDDNYIQNGLPHGAPALSIKDLMNNIEIKPEFINLKEINSMLESDVYQKVYSYVDNLNQIIQNLTAGKTQEGEKELYEMVDDFRKKLRELEKAKEYN